MKIYAGIEGGASFSKIVLLDSTGKILVRLDNEPGTNYMLMTRQEWMDRIYKIVIKALNKLPFDGKSVNTVQLESLGLCLSGCENEEDNLELSELFKEKYPNLCHQYSIASDTVGSIMTCSTEGGIVLIAGTGSNSLLVYPDGSSFRCGGWGHLLGDDGSAYWIAIRMIRYLIENDENYCPLQYDTTKAREILFDYFKIDNYMDLLKPLYHQFDKSYIAQFCAHIAKLALETNDALSLKVFQDAGKVLAQHVKALLPKIENNQTQVICVGSVFKSWCLLEKSFLNEIGSCPKLINIVYLVETSAIGAAYFAAKCSSIQLPVDYRKNYKILCRYQNGKKLN